MLPTIVDTSLLEYLLASLRNFSASDSDAALSMSNRDRLSRCDLVNGNSNLTSFSTGFVDSSVDSLARVPSNLKLVCAIVGEAVFVSISRSVFALLGGGTLIVADIVDSTSSVSLDSLTDLAMGTIAEKETVFDDGDVDVGGEFIV